MDPTSNFKRYFFREHYDSTGNDVAAIHYQSYFRKSDDQILVKINTTTDGLKIKVPDRFWKVKPNLKFLEHREFHPSLFLWIDVYFKRNKETNKWEVESTNINKREEEEEYYYSSLNQIGYFINTDFYIHEIISKGKKIPRKEQYPFINLNDYFYPQAIRTFDNIVVQKVYGSVLGFINKNPETFLRHAFDYATYGNDFSPRTDYDNPFES